MNNANQLNQTTLAASNLAIIHIENEACEAVIALQGAQILKYRRKNAKSASELLWCSTHLPKQGEKAIRGGIPLCFPWFGAYGQNAKDHANFPAHGFARTSLWTLQHIESSHDEHELQFVLHSSAQTKVYWNHDFEARMTLRCGRTLTLEFNVLNTDTQSFSFGFAWHSYFAVSSLNAVRIGGLAHTYYIDQLSEINPHLEHMEWVQVNAETDRIYYQSKGHFSIQEKGRQITIESPDCPDAVLWNPWIDKAARLNDMDDAAWQEFVCLESGHIQNWLELKPKQSQSFCMTLKLDSE